MLLPLFSHFSTVFLRNILWELDVTLRLRTDSRSTSTIITFYTLLVKSNRNQQRVNNEMMKLHINFQLHWFNVTLSQRNETFIVMLHLIYVTITNCPLSFLTCIVEYKEWPNTQRWIALYSKGMQASNMYDLYEVRHKYHKFKKNNDLNYLCLLNIICVLVKMCD